MVIINFLLFKFAKKEKISNTINQKAYNRMSTLPSENSIIIEPYLIGNTPI